MRAVAITVLSLALMACGPAAAPSQDAPQTPPPAPVRISLEEGQTRVSALPAPYNAANYRDGQQIFGQCASCHTLAASGPGRAGPSLAGLFGRHVGTVEGFNYSPALRDADFVWGPEQLDHWLANPREFLPGNRMAFIGVRNETQRRDVIAYLMVATATE